MDHNMVSTTFNLPGYTIRLNIGVVRGIIVRATELSQGVTEVLAYGTAVIVDTAS